MAIAQDLVARWQELGLATKAHLASVPVDQLDWRPHEKSMTLGELAAHIATIAGWTTILTQDSATVGSDSDAHMPVLRTNDELVSTFDQVSQAFVELLAQKSDADLAEHWKLLWNGQTVLDAPRQQVVETVIIQHLIHHRAQLGLYLRLLDVAVPATYGPTADGTQ